MAQREGWADLGDRVQAARVAVGMSQFELGEAIGLDRTMVAKIESGVRRVDALELARLSSGLGVPMAYFLDALPLVLSRRTVTLTDDTETAAGRESNMLDIALGNWIRELRQLIDLGLLAVRPPLRYPSAVQSPDEARIAARWVREQLGRGDAPIESMMSLCAQAGQFVLVTSLQGDGASAVDGDLGAAVVSLHGEPGRRRATAAHELGHLVLGDEYSSDLGVHASRDARESVIDAFAAELLLPISAFGARSKTNGPLTRDHLVQIAASFRTSWSMLLRQADVAGVGPIPKRWSQSKPTRAEFLEALGWTPQPDLESIRVPPAFAHAVMQAWRDDLITRNRAVELMHGQIDAADLPVDTEGDLAL